VELQGKYKEMDELRKQEETRQQKLKKAREELAAAELELESLNPYELPKDEIVSVLLVIGYIIYTHTCVCVYIYMYRMYQMRRLFILR